MDEYKISYVDTEGSDINGRYYFIVVDINCDDDRLWIIYDTVDHKFYSYSLLCTFDSTDPSLIDTFKYIEENKGARQVHVYKKPDSKLVHPTVSRFLKTTESNPEIKEALIKDIEKGIVEGTL